ncbi:MAG: sulfotransferase [Thiohalocapsa sp.]|nr:sulfotransferase [Thiohalocapsa sp.]
MDQKIKVLYIAGTGKTGSTLLGKLLGQVEGVVDVGELINIDVQYAHDEKCGCSAPVKSCAFWTQVVEQGVGGIERLDRKRWHRLKTRYLPLLAIPGAKRFLTGYFAQLHDLHRAVHDVGGARVVADSSKSAFYGAVLNLFPDIDVYTLHLVRDVRASEGSMYRLKHEGSEKFSRRSTWWNSVRWMLVNLVTEWAAKWVRSPYERVRYEDLVAHPEQTLRKILDFVGASDAELGFLDGNTATLGKTHTIAGSGVRFKESAMDLKLDERWRTTLPEDRLAVVDRWTSRFRRRYGY